MPKYKKCPRCELNYILENEEYCEICREELRGISHNDEIDDEGEGEICPICHVNFLNEGETICESCAAEAELDGDGKGRVIDDVVEPDWGDLVDEESVDEADLADEDVELSVEDLAEEEALEDEEEDGYEDDYDLDEVDGDGYEEDDNE